MNLNWSGMLEGIAAKLSSQEHPLLLFQIRSYYIYLLGHISDKELNSIIVSSEEKKKGS